LKNKTHHVSSTHPCRVLAQAGFQDAGDLEKNVQRLPQKRARLEVMRFDLGCRNAIAICIDPDLGYSESVVVVC